MRDESQNALLKTLEEPPGFAHLILLSSEPEALLETISSRCQPVEFAPLPDRGGRGGARGRRRRRSPPPRGSRPATSSCARFLLTDAGQEAARRRRCELVASAPARRVGRPPGASLLKAAEEVGADAEAAAREALEEEKEAGVKRSAREMTDEAKRAGRRRRTEVLDLGLGALRRLVPRPRGGRLRRRGGRLQPRPPRRSCAPPPRASTRPPPAAPPSWSRTPAAASTSTSPRSWRWKPSTSASSDEVEAEVPAGPIRRRADDAGDVARLLHDFNSEYED